MEWLVVVLLATVAYVLFRLRRNRVDISVLPEHFVVIDVETTGLDALRHEIIEIGAVQVNRDSKISSSRKASQEDPPGGLLK
jgi:DNA polymerase III alpha subunit (gram-positive type)